MAVSSMVENASERHTCLDPSRSTIVREIDAAAPVRIRIPERTPAVMIRTMAGTRSLMPSDMAVTVVSSPMSPISPPTSAPRIML